MMKYLLILLLIQLSCKSTSDKTSLKTSSEDGPSWAKIDLDEEINDKQVVDFANENFTLRDKVLKRSDLENFPEQLPVVLEDGTKRVKALHAFFYSDGSLAYDDLAEIAEKEGFELFIYDGDPGFLEDYMEFHQDGSVSYPALRYQLKVNERGYISSDGDMDIRNSDDIIHSINLSRIKRYYGDKYDDKEIDQTYKDALKKGKKDFIDEGNKSERSDIRYFSHPRNVESYTEKYLYKKFPLMKYQRARYVAEHDTQEYSLKVAIKHNRPTRDMLSHVEGGNILVGINKKGEYYGLVGLDSVAVTQSILSRELKRKVSEKESLQVIAKDFGIPSQNLVAIEQPGDFHIDMYMALAPRGKVFLNDAMKSWELQKTWTENDPYLKDNNRTDLLKDINSDVKEKSRTLAKYEKMIVSQLKKAGVEYEQLPLAYLYNEPTEGKGELTLRSTFLNMEAGIGKDGKRFAIVNDAMPTIVSDKYQPEMMKFVESLVKEKFDIDRVHFVYSAAFLDGDGSLSCLLKMEAYD
jgi:hypothetical protein